MEENKKKKDEWEEELQRYYDWYWERGYKCWIYGD